MTTDTEHLAALHRDLGIAPCSVAGCPKQVYVKGLCNAHYLRNKIYGTPTEPMRIHYHGLTGTPTHRSWRKMRERCLNPKATQFKWYGGRGIAICERWSLFENFFADMGERPAGKSLDRIDTNGNYEPINCRWATHQEQIAGQRKTIRLSNGMTIRELSEIAGISYGAAYWVIKSMRRSQIYPGDAA